MGKIGKNVKKIDVRCPKKVMDRFDDRFLSKVGNFRPEKPGGK